MKALSNLLKSKFDYFARNSVLALNEQYINLIKASHRRQVKKVSGIKD
jgi:hypothetical protein